MRASDADRETYVSLLQNAYLEGRLSREEYDERMGAAYQAVTYGELAPLLADLPVPPQQIPLPPGLSRSPVVADGQQLWRVAPTGVHVDQAPVVSAFSNVKRDGRWAVSSSQVAVSIFGQIELDLRQAMLEAPHTELKVSAVFGNVEVTVPGDLNVEVSGVGIFGEYARKDSRVPGAPEPAPGAPKLTISGAAVFGQVRVTIVDAPATGTDRILPPPPQPPAIEPPGRGRDAK